MQLDLSNLDLDWELAVARFAKDCRDDFFPDPIGYQDILRNRPNTIHHLKDLSTSFQPRYAGSYDVPKQNFLVRHSIHLGPFDRIVYQAILDRLLPELDAALHGRSYAHRLNAPRSDYVFRNPIQAWKSFVNDVRSAARANPASFLVATDVAQYFESINFKKLRRQVDRLLPSTLHGRVVDALFRCLRDWSPYRYRGLPQNVDASSALGNVYLDYVDRRMLRLDIQYFRYMDDIRIIAPDEATARLALLELVTVLRDLDLTLNSQKTRMITPDTPDWHAEVADDDPVIETIENLLKEKTRHAAQVAIPILLEKISDILANNRTGDAAFRFCVNRIVTLRAFRHLEWPDLDEIVGNLISVLVRRPCDTATICSLFRTLELSSHRIEQLSELLLNEPLCIYSWQRYHLWLLVTQRNWRSELLLRHASDQLRSSPKDPNQAGACLYLGSCGDYSDSEMVRMQLD